MRRLFWAVLRVGVVGLAVIQLVQCVLDAHNVPRPETLKAVPTRKVITA